MMKAKRLTNSKFMLNKMKNKFKMIILKVKQISIMMRSMNKAIKMNKILMNDCIYKLMILRKI